MESESELNVDEEIPTLPAIIETNDVFTADPNNWLCACAAGCIINVERFCDFLWMLLILWNIYS